MLARKSSFCAVTRSIRVSQNITISRRTQYLSTSLVGVRSPSLHAMPQDGATAWRIVVRLLDGILPTIDAQWRTSSTQLPDLWNQATSPIVRIYLIETDGNEESLLSVCGECITVLSETFATGASTLRPIAYAKLSGGPCPRGFPT